MKKFKNLCAGILMGGIVLTSGIVAGCGKEESPSGNVTDMYAFAGATAGILASEDVGTVMSTSSVTEGQDQIMTNLKNQMNTAISQTLDKYMNMFDAVIGGEKPVDVTENESDKDDFTHKLTIRTNTINNETSTFTLYFNETLKNGKEVIDTDDEEKETVLEGELYINDNVTPLYVFGKKEIDKKENEFEIEFEARFDKNDRTRRIVFSQEIEEKNNKREEEYSIEIVIGDFVEEFSFEMEKNENGELEVEYEVNEIKFEIEKTREDKITIKTDDLFGLELVINVTIENVDDQERYVYSIPLLDNFVIQGTLR